MKQNIFNFIGFDSEYEEAELVLMGFHMMEQFHIDRELDLLHLL